MPEPLPTPRQLADGYVDRLCVLDPTLATVLGRTPAPDGLPDLSPAGLDAVAAAAARDARRARPGGRRPGPRCRDWWSSAALGCCASGSPPPWPAARGRRGPALAVQPLLPAALGPAGVRADALPERRGLGGGRPAAGAGARGLPRLPAPPWRRARRAGCSPVRAGRRTVVEQLAEWSAGPYFAALVADGPAGLRAELDRAAAAADAAVVAVHDFLRDAYAPQAAGRPRRRGPGALRPVRAPLERHRPRDRRRAGGRLRVGLGRVPPDPRRAAGRGRPGAARRRRRCRRWRGSASTARRWTASRQIRAAAAADDGRGDGRPRRHPLRPRRAESAGSRR